jgi:signal transduction histidine kinase
MNKISRLVGILLSVIYIIGVFVLMIENKNITQSYNLSTWLITTIFVVSILYICYRYIYYRLREDKLEEEIISIVNHSFRTPLTSMSWYIKELEKNLPQNERLLYLQNLTNSTNKVLSVVDALVGIKDVKNTSGYSFEAISMREIVEKSIKKYRDQINKKNIAFEVTILKNVPLLTMDLNKISFVIDTILENAILYTNREGKILINCIADTKKLTLFISDTGIGLETMDKFMIFRKFYRSKKAILMNTDGMGLRLYLCKEIIQRHHGKIYARSNGVNEGTTFFIELPFSK